MTNFQTGRRAEAAAAVYLAREGYRILEQNWRTRYCEIDIVAERESTVYLVEVKYRANKSYGSGLDYITAQKLRQMVFAARFWVAKRAWSGDFGIAAVSVSGQDFMIEELCLIY